MMFMSFYQGVIGLVLIMIVLLVFIPITQELLPTMIGDMGVGLGVMVSTIVVVIIAVALFVFVRQSTGQDQHAAMGQF